MSVSKHSTYEENNWAYVFTCLKDVARALLPTIEERLEQHIEGWRKITVAEFEEFVQKVNVGTVIVQYVSFRKRSGTNVSNAWEIINSEGYPDYQNVLKEILAIHSNSRSKTIQWKSDEYFYLSKPFWKLAKVFMPYGNRCHSGPAEADAISIFDLLKNCTLFNDFDASIVDQLCSARNQVVHSIDNRLTFVQRNHYLAAMNNLLDTPCLQYKPGVQNLKIRLTQIKDQNLYFEEVDMEYFEREFKVMLPGKHFNREEFKEDINKVYERYVSSYVHILKKELEMDKKCLEKAEAEVVKYKRIGAAAGASVIGTTGAVVGGVAASFIAGSVITVAAPAIVAGGIAAGIGYFAGRAGGGVIGSFSRLN